MNLNHVDGRYYIQSNGQPLTIAHSREHAASKLGVDVSSIAQVVELAPRDRYPELLDALDAGELYEVAC